jgi:hypothetical protein
MTTGTNLDRAGSLLAIYRSPLPAACPHNDCGVHGAAPLCADSHWELVSELKR